MPLPSAGVTRVSHHTRLPPWSLMTPCWSTISNILLKKKKAQEVMFIDERDIGNLYIYMYACTSARMCFCVEEARDQPHVFFRSLVFETGSVTGILGWSWLVSRCQGPPDSVEGQGYRNMPCLAFHLDAGGCTQVPMLAGSIVLPEPSPQPW